MTRVQLPVVVENDANAAAWGEFRFGAGRDVDDLALITVGTGIGGGFLGGNGERLTGPMITDQARAGDPMCIALLADAGRWLGEGIASLVAAFDPAVVLIGGGVAAAGDLLLAPAQHALVRTLPAANHRTNPKLRLAALGNTAGMIGAADLARQA